MGAIEIADRDPVVTASQQILGDDQRLHRNVVDLHSPLHRIEMLPRRRQVAHPDIGSRQQVPADEEGKRIGLDHRAERILRTP